MKGILKGPLIVSALVVVLRVVAERVGAPHLISASLSAAALIVLLGPLYFAYRIGGSNEPRPYLKLIKLTFLYALWTRVMVLPTYWLARMFQWPEPRFVGAVEADITDFVGFVAVPLLTAAFWIVGAVVVGGAIGAIVILVMRSRVKTA